MSFRPTQALTGNPGHDRRRSEAPLWWTAALLLVACATAEQGGEDGGPGGGVDANGGQQNHADASTCPSTPCDVVRQCGCLEPMVCDLDVENPPASACRQVSSPGTEEANCSSFDQCAGGYVCLGPAGSSQCRRYCEFDVDCGQGGYCVLGITYGGGMETGTSACTKGCAPELPSNNGCPASPQLACHFFLREVQGNQRWVSDCVGAGAGTDEVDCSANGVRDCAPGYTCITFTVDDEFDRQVCKQTCLTGGGGPACEVGECQELVNDPPVEIDNKSFGICN